MYFCSASGAGMRNFLGECWLFDGFSRIWERRACILDESDCFDFTRLFFHDQAPTNDLDLEMRKFARCFFINSESSIERCIIDGTFEHESTQRHGIKINGNFFQNRSIDVCRRSIEPRLIRLHE